MRFELSVDDPQGHHLLLPPSPPPPHPRLWAADRDCVAGCGTGTWTRAVAPAEKRKNLIG